MMEGDVRKRGVLYLYQQRFGKKWRKLWAEAFCESSNSVSRLELFDFSKSSMKDNKKQKDSKRVIILRDCVQIRERENNDCKKECSTFTMETSNKSYVFSCPQEELQSWITELCLLAFSKKQTDSRSAVPDLQTTDMQENSLYATTSRVRDYLVVMVRTDAAVRCDLKGEYFLTPQENCLLLKSGNSKQVVLSWPYRYIRKFGQDMLCFNFEAGRRCESGEGYFEFATSYGEEIFNIINTSIRSLPKSETPGAQPKEQQVPLHPQGSYTPPAPRMHHKNKLMSRNSMSVISMQTGDPFAEEPSTVKACSLSSDPVYAMISKPASPMHKRRDTKRQPQPLDLPPDSEKNLEKSMMGLSMDPGTVVEGTDVVYSKIVVHEHYESEEVSVDDDEDLNFFPPPPSDVLEDFQSPPPFLYNSSEDESGIAKTPEATFEHFNFHAASTGYSMDPMYSLSVGVEESVDSVEDLGHVYAPYQPSAPMFRSSSDENAQAEGFSTYDNIMSRGRRQ